MKRSKFSDEQIPAIVKEGEAGRKIADLCRANGLTEQVSIRTRKLAELEKAVFGGRTRPRAWLVAGMQQSLMHLFELVSNQESVGAEAIHVMKRIPARCAAV